MEDKPVWLTETKSETQDDFLNPTHQQNFDAWVHTPQGGQVANLFIRLAIGCRRRGVRVGTRAIWERIRWHYNVRKVQGEPYKLNDHHHAYMARFAMERVEELRGYFEIREVGKQKPTRPVFVKQGIVLNNKV